MTGGGEKRHVPPRSLARIRTLHERWLGDADVARHEIWSLVEVSGERKVLFEAHSPENANASQPAEQRLMTIREALRGPRTVARQIWLALQE